jgi:hypothetical protein
MMGKRKFWERTSGVVLYLLNFTTATAAAATTTTTIMH